jgi:hypothetical protein
MRCEASPQEIKVQSVKNDAPLKMDELSKEAQYYKESSAILGLGLTELESFINPTKKPARPPQKSSGSHTTNPTPMQTQSSFEELQNTLLERLDRVDYMLEQKCANWTEM